MEGVSMVRVVMFAAVLLFAASPAGAQYYDPSQLAKVKEVHVAVDDGVEDGCLPQPNALKVEAELILRRSGIKVVPSRTQLQHNLDIFVIGYAWGGGCIASVSLEFYRSEKLSDGRRALVLAFQRETLSSGPKDDFQQRLREVVNRNATVLANEILKARQK
jgi:hypothetical protein